MKLTMDKLRRIMALAKHNGNDVNMELVKYLYSLPYEEVLEVETLMLWGRDLYCFHACCDSLETIYHYNFNEWGGDRGSKELAVPYIVGKGPLHTYLQFAYSELCKHMTGPITIPTEGMTDG